MAAGILINEKRQLQRRELIYYLRVNELLTSSELGRLVDIHIKGLMLIGNKSLNVGQEYLIGVELPRVLSEQGLPQIGAKARCVWVRPSQARPFSESGLMFLETREEARRSISMLIDLFALPDVMLKA
ncbi:MAG: PilZ domain-containing protein [Deltaproteobacteria bacterium]|jgi:hypothetical protein|nr:PilZ domain-containing protein [Deltaproteobacteria bacterium]